MTPTMEGLLPEKDSKGLMEETSTREGFIEALLLGKIYSRGTSNRSGTTRESLLLERDSW